MKSLYISLLLIISISVKSQTPVLSLSESEQYGEVDGAYFKDLDNDFDSFTGTWQYTNGTTIFKIILKKHEQYYNSFSKLYTDVIYGEYQYIENGIEKVNTLYQLQNTSLNPYLHNISGNSINRANMFPLCNTCNPNQKRVLLSIEDPTRSMIDGLKGRMILRRVDSGDVQKIEMWLKQQGNIIYTEDNPPQYTSLSIPWGTYVLTKVN